MLVVEVREELERELHHRGHAHPDDGERAHHLRVPDEPDEGSSEPVVRPPERVELARVRGEVGRTIPAERFPVRFYLVAMLFVIFDVEVILFFPWAVSFKQFPMFSLIAMSVFVGLLLVAFVYEWRNGGLEWD